MKEIKNIYIETYGCSANQNNSEIMAGLLQQAGLNLVKNKKIADIAVLNTCIVKGPTEQRMISRIKQLGREFGKGFIVTGCMADAKSILIKNFAPEANLLGSHHIHKVCNSVKKISLNKSVEEIELVDEIKLCMHKLNQNRVIGITQILEGCLGGCSFCITRFAKGKLFSYPKEKILDNVSRDLAGGCKEIWLTSQDNAAYGLDRGKNELPALLKEIQKLDGRFMIRLGMMNPNNIIGILDKLIECYDNEKMFKFLHLPLQSGSDNVLKDMNRQYNVKDFLRIAKKFRGAFPSLTLSTDIIVGYPTEKDSDFNKSLSLIRRIKPEILNISKFWPHEGTAAGKLEQLDKKIVKGRAYDMMQLHNKIALKGKKNLINSETMCLVDRYGFDSTWLARNPDYRLIVLQGKEKNLLGRFCKVRIAGAKSHYLNGQII